MVNFKIVIQKMHEKCKVIEKTLKENPSVINDTIYTILTHYGIDTETAIDCACWCELAIIGDSYNTDEFDVYVEEE